MSFIGDWAMTCSCTVWPYGGRDVYGNITWGEPVFIPNIWWKTTNEKFTDAKGNELTSSFKLITRIENKPSLVYGYYIVLDSDETATAIPTVLSDSKEIKSVQVIASDAVGSVDTVIVMG